jgi:hypothetical protein
MENDSNFMVVPLGLLILFGVALLLAETEAKTASAAGQTSAHNQEAIPSADHASRSDRPNLYGVSPSTRPVLVHSLRSGSAPASEIVSEPILVDDAFMHDARPRPAPMTISSGSASYPPPSPTRHKSLQADGDGFPINGSTQEEQMASNDEAH